MTSSSRFFTSESVTEGHADKDVRSDFRCGPDAMWRKTRVRAWRARQPPPRPDHRDGRSDHQTLTSKFKTWCATPFPRIALTTDGSSFVNARTCGVLVSLKAIGPTSRWCGRCAGAQARRDVRRPDRSGGRGRSGMMPGLSPATKTEEYMPLTIALAHKLCRELATARKSGQLPWRVPMQEPGHRGIQRGKPCAWTPSSSPRSMMPTSVMSTISEEVIGQIGTRWCRAMLLDKKTKYYVNPDRRFVSAAPMGDAGVTGPQIIRRYVRRHGAARRRARSAARIPEGEIARAAYFARLVRRRISSGGLWPIGWRFQVSYAIGVARRCR